MADFVVLYKCEAATSVNVLNQVNEAIFYSFIDVVLSSGMSSLALKWLRLLFFI